MVAAASLREHLVEELNDLLNAEQQLIKALPDMARQASTHQLKNAFRSHLAQTRTHERRVASALRTLGEQPDGKTCEAMKGLLGEGEDLMSGGQPSALLDAMLITAAQKVEHYEIATYGTVRTYAQVLGELGVARLMDQTLKEEKRPTSKQQPFTVAPLISDNIRGRAANQPAARSPEGECPSRGNTASRSARTTFCSLRLISSPSKGTAAKRFTDTTTASP